MIHYRRMNTFFPALRSVLLKLVFMLHIRVVAGVKIFDQSAFSGCLLISHPVSKGLCHVYQFVSVLFTAKRVGYADTDTSFLVGLVCFLGVCFSHHACRSCPLTAECLLLSGSSSSKPWAPVVWPPAGHLAACELWEFISTEFTVVYWRRGAFLLIIRKLIFAPLCCSPTLTMRKFFFLFVFLTII